MGSKLVVLLNIIGLQPLVEKAESVANTLARRLPPNELLCSNIMQERQIDILLSGLASRSQRYKDGGKWGFLMKLAFKHSLRISLNKLGYADEFSNLATYRIARF